MAGQAETDVKTLAEAERIRRNKERLAAAKAERERILKRVREAERGQQLIGRKPPKRIKRGKFKEPAETSKVVIQEEPGKAPTIAGAFRRAADVVAGKETKRRIRRATEPRKKKR